MFTRLLSLLLIGAHRVFHATAFNDIWSGLRLTRYEGQRSPLVMGQHQALDGESVIQSLIHYRKLNSNLRIPSKFIVPSDAKWPTDLHGFRLGTVLKRIKYRGVLPEYHEKIREIGFVMNPLDQKFEVFITALVRYKDLNNNCTMVPRDFVVPKNSLWPEDCWGLKLGSKVSTTRYSTVHGSTECVERLNQIGFIWDPSQKSADLFLITLRLFKETNGHLNIPKNYVIPDESTIYPKEAWGMKIGLKTNNFVYRGDYPAYKDRIEEIGLSSVKMGFDTRHWDYIYTALKTYRDIYGGKRIPPSFMVPESKLWPESIWGLKLGYRLHNIRYRGDFVNDKPEYRILLEDLGFRCDKLRSKVQ